MERQKKEEIYDLLFKVKQSALFRLPLSAKAAAYVEGAEVVVDILEGVMHFSKLGVVVVSEEIEEVMFAEVEAKARFRCQAELISVDMDALKGAVDLDPEQTE
jgi:hypothetical protein